MGAKKAKNDTNDIKKTNVEKKIKKVIKGDEPIKTKKINKSSKVEKKKNKSKTDNSINAKKDIMKKEEKVLMSKESEKLVMDKDLKKDVKTSVKEDNNFDSIQTKTKFNKVNAKKNDTDVKLKMDNDKKTKKVSKDKRKGNVLKVILVVLLIILIGSLLTFLTVNSSSPKKTVDGFLTNIREGDFETAKVFIISNNEDFTNSFDKEVLDLLFDKLTWKVNGVEVNDNSAVVNIDITNKDFKIVTDNYMKRVNEAAKAFITGKQFTQSDFHRFFIEELKNSQVGTVTSNKNINLTKDGKEWKLVGDDKLVDALVSDLLNSLVTENNQ